MSSSSIQTLVFASHQTTIYIGFFGLLSGLLGNTLNIIIFTSLKTFRETSCAFYLTAASVFNIFYLTAALLSRILITGYSIDLTQTSLVLCQLRQFVATAGLIIAMNCTCFATIDQFLSLIDRWRYLSQRCIAWRLVLFTILFWCLYSIPVIIYYNNIYSPNTGKWTCTITNAIFSSYFNRFHISILIGFLPLIIRISFGLLAFLNARSLANRRIPIVRLERDKQLTAMVLIQTVVDVVLSLPFVIYYTYSTYISTSESTVYPSVVAITNIFYYLTFAVGFYIYFCSSSRYRKQLIYVLIKVHLKYWCGTDIELNNNRIVPQPNIIQAQPAVIQLNI